MEIMETSKREKQSVQTQRKTVRFFFMWGWITKYRSLNIYQYSTMCVHWSSVTEQRNNMFAYTNDISVFVFIQSGIIFHTSTTFIQRLQYYTDYNIINITHARI